MSDAPSVLDSAIDDLLSGRRRRQEAAHEALMQLAEGTAWREELVARLTPLAAHDSAQVRGTAYLALATAQGEKALELLRAHLDEREADARLDLTEALAGIGAPAREMLLQLLRDEIFEVRFAAAGGLVQQREMAAADVLLEALRHSDLRYLALSALQHLGDPRALEPARKLFKKTFLSGFERAAAAGVLARLGDADGRRWLVERIARRKGAERGVAVEIAGELKLTEAIEPLRACVADKNDPFRGACVRVLGMMGDEAQRELIERVLFDPAEEPEARMDAAEGLMSLGSPEARRSLERARAEIEEEEIAEVVRGALEQLKGQEEGAPK